MIGKTLDEKYSVDGRFVFPVVENDVASVTVARSGFPMITGTELVALRARVKERILSLQEGLYNIEAMLDHVTITDENTEENDG